MAPSFDDDDLTLSSHALDALEEFYTDRDTHAQKFAKLAADPKQQHALERPLSMDAFAEDWNESQFWYSDHTASLLAEQLLDGATEDQTIAVVSTPSVFVALKNLVASPSRCGKPRPRLFLLEHDKRFAVFPEFVFYDYTCPLRLPAHLQGTADRIICDPPFLNEDCHTKAALTVRWLSRPGCDARLLVGSGERMEPLVRRLYRGCGMRTTDFPVEHRGGLSNEYRCYANFECRLWRWADGR